MKAIIILGPPGSGKGTQADIVATHHRVIHFDTGRYIEQAIAAQSAANDLKGREEFEQGKLRDPHWVLPVLKREIKKIARAGFGVVLSGSPRSLFEAFGDKKHKGLIPFLCELYRKENIFVFILQVPPRVSIARNTKRRVCTVCGKTNLMGARIRHCPFCGGKLRRRSLDQPDIIKVRLKEYKERTVPVLRELKKQGFRVVAVDGTKKPADIFSSINRVLPADTYGKGY